MRSFHKIRKHPILKYLSGSFFICAFSMNALFCQEKINLFEAKNASYIDFSPTGIYYTINYDRIVFEVKSVFLSGRVGFSIWSSAVAFPLGVNLFTGQGNSHLECGLTLIPCLGHHDGYSDWSNKYLYIMPEIGYRFQKPNGGFFMKAHITPSILFDPKTSDFWNNDLEYAISGSVGLGFSF